MSTISTLPSYKDMADVLESTAIQDTPAQVHGLMCGLICGTSGDANNRWQSLLFQQTKKPKDLTLLTDLYETSYHQISEFSFEFTLLLPDDQVEIKQRTEALGTWCQGFLIGLEHANVPIKNRAPSDVTETINDIIEIAQVSFEDVAEDEEDETAYYELVEYVRLGVLMIFHELLPRAESNAESEDDNNNLLH